VGPQNFKSIQINNLHLSPPLLEETIELINGTPQHSHNWIITKLVEDGIIGATLFSCLILMVLNGLWRHLAVNKKEGVNWIWLASFSAIIIAMTSGFFNSAFTHENGWLTFFLMGLGAGHITQKTIG
jgi:O-antigen ligase